MAVLLDAISGVLLDRFAIPWQECLQEQQHSATCVSEAAERAMLNYLLQSEAENTATLFWVGLLVSPDSQQIE